MVIGQKRAKAAHLQVPDCAVGEDVYGRPEKLLILTSEPVISMMIALVWFIFLLSFFTYFI